MVEARLPSGGGAAARVLSMVSALATQATNAKPSASGGSSGGGGALWSSSSYGVAVAVTAMAGVALAAVLIYSRRGSLKSPWSRRRRKHALAPQQWKNFFSSDGKLLDGGIKFLKKVRSGGVDPSIRAEVWPFLLGVYDLNSTREERFTIKNRKRKEYNDLRKQCRRLLRNNSEYSKKSSRGSIKEEGCSSHQDLDNSPCSEDVVSARQSLSTEEASLDSGGDIDSNLTTDHQTLDKSPSLGEADSPMLGENGSLDDSEEEKGKEQEVETEEDEETSPFSSIEGENRLSKVESIKGKNDGTEVADEDFATWQRIIRLDALRANAEWVPYSPSQALVSEAKARRAAEAVGLRDYNHLEPCRIYHATRLVAILEAYALYDPETGYCQGMSDLLSPIVAIIEEDHEAFWCFVGFMKSARHNFRLDEVGIRRQLNIVSRIIKTKDSQLYRHLEKVKAEDCFFVYRMVVVLFRRELNFEQTVCLWEVVWADQAAIRAGVGGGRRGRARRRGPPPTNDLLLYAIAAGVLQRRKLIIERYNSMDEILRECNSMAGQLDVWKLLDDAHDLVASLHDKI
ncbi:hypothetical protein AMTRI_Chr09g19120 [Amborella trichopoda]